MLAASAGEEREAPNDGLFTRVSTTPDGPALLVGASPRDASHGYDTVAICAAAGTFLGFGLKIDWTAGTPLGFRRDLKRWKPAASQSQSHGSPARTLRPLHFITQDI